MSRGRDGFDSVPVLDEHAVFDPEQIVERGAHASALPFADGEYVAAVGEHTVKPPVRDGNTIVGGGLERPEIGVAAIAHARAVLREVGGDELVELRKRAAQQYFFHESPNARAVGFGTVRVDGLVPFHLLSHALSAFARVRSACANLPQTRHVAAIAGIEAALGNVSATETKPPTLVGVHLLLAAIERAVEVASEKGTPNDMLPWVTRLRGLGSSLPVGTKFVSNGYTSNGTMRTKLIPDVKTERFTAGLRGYGQCVRHYYGGALSEYLEAWVIRDGMVSEIESVETTDVPFTPR